MNREHEELLTRWKQRELHANQHFISDGIIDLDHWGAVNRKILFIFKEAYGDVDDLRVCIRDTGLALGQTFWPAAYWAYGLQNLSDSDVPRFPEYRGEESRNCLLSAAVVNIKKSNGRSQTDSEELDIYAEQDGDLLREQIELIDPTIIVCGYTFSQFEKFICHQDELEAISNADMIYRFQHRLVIDWWHPANRYPAELCYYALCAVAQKATDFFA